jgi:hypothetical protein
MSEYLRSIFGNQSNITFDDFYRLMKVKLIENRARREASDEVIVEDTEKSIVCFLWPWGTNEVKT